MKQLWDRWAPLTGALSVACSLVGVMFVLDQPQEKDSDAKIVAYFAQHSHRVDGIVGFFVFLAGAMLLVAFLATLRERLPAGRAAALAFAAGIASVPLWAVSILLADATSLATSETSAFRVDPNTFRLFANASYAAWVAAVAVSALVVWAVSAVALRTGVLPRWYALAGIPVGIVQLFGWLFFPFFVWWLWLIVTSVLLVLRPRTAAAVVAQPALP